jgi:glycerol-3-phosphate acyltransferase PlsY
MLVGISLLLLAYLLGSIPTGYLLGLLAGVDVRENGSGNIGATNVARLLGRGHGIATLIADTLKGSIPVYVALKLGLASTVIAGVASAAFLGHLYPVFLRFGGGKGVATALGVLLVWAPLATVVLAVIFAALMVVCRIVSLSSLVTAAAAPLVLWLFSYNWALIGTSLFFAGMIILRHHANIQRLRAGTEPRFSFNSR